MSQLRERLETRLREEIACYRATLDHAAPVAQAHARYDAPALFKSPADRWFTAGHQVPSGSRVVAYGEALDMLDSFAGRLALIEALTIERLASLFIEDEQTRTAAVDRIADHWPWTVAEHGDVPFFLARYQMHMKAAGTENPLWDPCELQLASMPWPPHLDLAETVDFIADGLERAGPGEGNYYRQWCMGLAETRVYSEFIGKGTPEDPAVVDETRFTHELSANVLRDRTGKPDSRVFKIRVSATEELKKLVTGEQLAWIYWAIPEPVRLARTVSRYVASVASGTAQQRLLRVIAPKAITEERGTADSEAIGKLAEAVRHQVERLLSADFADLWPATVAESTQRARELDECFAAHLERVGSRGKTLADGVRDKSSRREPGDEWKLWRPEEKGERFLLLLARALWVDVLQPELERARQLEPVRVSTNMANTIALARMYGAPRRNDDAWIIVEPPKGIALMLPFDDTLRVDRRGSGLISLRQVLTGRALRTYLATLVLYQDCGMRDDGSFEFDGPDSILDITAATKSSEVKRGRIYQRFTTKDRKAIAGDLLTFTRIRVRAVGELEAAAGDPLVDEVRSRAGGKTVAYMHARLIAQQLRSDYTRIPRKVCQLEVSDVPVAMGISLLARGKMLAHLKNKKSIEAPLKTWTDAAGINASEGARKHGRGFWDLTAENLARVSEAGEIGQIKIAGTGPDAVVTLSLNDALRQSYQPLLTASVRHEKAGRAARVADKRRKR